VYVIGMGFRPLEQKARERVLESDVVLANNRLLDVFKNYNEYEDVKDKILVHPSVYETVDYIRENYRLRKISLLAAGDPMFFGIGRLIVEKLGKDAVEVYPDLSSIQVAFSRIRETLNNALLLSLHGGPNPEKRRKLEYDITELPHLLEGHNKIAVLTDKVNNPGKIAETFLEPSAISRQQTALRIYVCEKLGYADEKITAGSPEDIARGSFEHPNVVVLVRSEEQNVGANGRSSLPPPFPASDFVFGLKEAEIEHSRGLITKDEVRAVTIHKLRLPSKGVFWDIGAGSGSVSVEAARICPELNVYAIEKKEELVEIISANKSGYGIANIHVIHGTAPEIFDGLPLPARVFIGGSGGNLDAVIKFIADQSLADIVVNATTIETLNEAVHSLGNNNFRVQVSEVSVSRSKEIGGKKHMSALNPIYIITGVKGDDAG
jgi:precorrin-6Y C5,15-methyltransferase (decarboxylating)